MTDHVKVAVGILTYNVKDKLASCLKSLKAFLPHWPVFILDNGSTDGTNQFVKRHHPEVHYFRNPQNVFFPRGCNELVRMCNAEYTFLMNADISLPDDSCLGLLDYLENHPDHVAASPCVRDRGIVRHMASGIVSPSLCIARDSFIGKVLKKTKCYKMAMFVDTDPHATFSVPKITNACCLVRSQAFLACGGFNTDFIMYWTEEDFAIRLQQLKLLQAVVGRALVDHDHGSSSKKHPASLVRAIFVHDRLQYMRKHYGWRSTVLVELCLMIRPRFWRSLRDYYYLCLESGHLRQLQHDLMGMDLE